MEAAFARSTNSITELPAQNTYSSSDLTQTPIVRTGGIGFFENNDGKNQQYQALARTSCLARLSPAALRRAYENIDYNNITNYSGPTVHAVERPEDGDRRVDQHHGRSDLSARSTGSRVPISTTCGRRGRTT